MSFAERSVFAAYAVVLAVVLVYLVIIALQGVAARARRADDRAGAGST